MRKRVNNNVKDSNEITYKNLTGKIHYHLTNDYMFRVVMQKNKKVLKHLIAALLGISVEELLFKYYLMNDNPSITITIQMVSPCMC